jgi:hypothetical protein
VIATVKLNIPVPSSMLVVNILGVLGLAGLTVSAGALSGNWWWSLLAGSVILIVLAVVASSHLAVAQVDERPATAPIAVARSA